MWTTLCTTGGARDPIGDVGGSDACSADTRAIDAHAHRLSRADRARVSAFENRREGQGDLFLRGAVSSTKMPTLLVTWMLAALAFHGGSTSGTGSTSGATGSTTLDAGSTGATGTTAGTSDGGTSDGSESSSAGEADDATSVDGSASATVDGADDFPSESSDAGVDPTFGPLDDGNVDDTTETDGCCDHPDNNSDNFLCRLGPGAPEKIGLAIVLVLLGRPRRRGGSR